MRQPPARRHEEPSTIRGEAQPVHLITVGRLADRQLLADQLQPDLVFAQRGQESLGASAGPVDTPLLVEDNPGDVELTERALRATETANHLTVASYGADALAHLRSPRAPGLIPTGGTLADPGKRGVGLSLDRLFVN